MEEPGQRTLGWKEPRGKGTKTRKQFGIRQENYQGHGGRK